MYYKIQDSLTAAGFDITVHSHVYTYIKLRNNITYVGELLHTDVNGRFRLSLCARNSLLLRTANDSLIIGEKISFNTDTHLNCYKLHLKYFRNHM